MGTKADSECTHATMKCHEECQDDRVLVDGELVLPPSPVSALALDELAAPAKERGGDDDPARSFRSGVSAGPDSPIKSGLERRSAAM